MAEEETEVVEEMVVEEGMEEAEEEEEVTKVGEVEEEEEGTKVGEGVAVEVLLPEVEEVVEAQVEEGAVAPVAVEGDRPTERADGRHRTEIEVVHREGPVPISLLQCCYCSFIRFMASLSDSYSGGRGFS